MNQTIKDLNIGDVFVYTDYDELYVGLKINSYIFSDVYSIFHKKVIEGSKYTNCMMWSKYRTTFKIYLFTINNFKNNKTNVIKAQNKFLKNYPEY